MIVPPRHAVLAAALAIAAAACGNSAGPAPAGTGAAVQPPVFFDAGQTGVAATAARIQVTHAPAPPAAVVRPVPGARTTAAATAEAAARWHLAQRAGALGYDAATLGSVEVTLVHDLGRGPIVVRLGQRVDGLPVIRTAMAIVMDRSLALIAISGELVAIAPGPAPAFALSAADAITRAIADAGAAPRALRPEPALAGYRRYAADGLVTPARARPVLFPVGGQLVAAYQSELAFDGAPIQGFAHVIAADDGRLLYRAGLSQDATHTYRVWADPSGLRRPLDGPVVNYTPHPTGLPDGYHPAYVAPILVTLDGLNSAPGGGTDPWLPAGATATTGNNIDAYADLDGADGFSGGDLRAEPTGPATFDRIYDTAAEPDASANQIKAAITQLFYTTNWLHDFWYDSGFTEAAGNAQEDNLGRGGVAGNRLHAEAQDSGGSDNANMFTPGDGSSPRMQMYLWSAAAGQARPDGTIDNEIVAHEFGHYLHHRLVDCGSQECGAMSEGWGDFNALLMTLRPGDNLDGVYGMGAYALASFTANSAYFGIRRFPYTTDLAKSPLTFRHVRTGEPIPPGAPYSDVFFLQGADNWEVHDAGEIWCSMLFAGLVELLRDSTGPSPRFTFNEARRRIADYMVAGMIAAPVEPDFTAQRDAILAAALAADPVDFATLAQAFATRGFGTAAVSPPVNSFDGAGVVEDFAVRGRPELVSATLVEDPAACDADGVIDAGESGRLIVQIRNVGAAALTAPTVTASSSIAGVFFPDGPDATFPDIPLFGTATVELAIRLGEVQPVPVRLPLVLSLREPGSPVPAVAATAQVDINLDITPGSSATDDVESPFPVWGDNGPWSRVRIAGNTVWSVAAPLAVTDAILTSPAVTVGAAPLTVAFEHRHAFGAGDGAVLEYSLNGTTWLDAGAIATTGYTGTIPAGTNPLAGRSAWTGTSPGFPALATTTIAFGTALAGQTVRFRFRMGGDALADGGSPWQVDTIALTGAGTPFPTTVVDDLSCLPGLRPVADAGADATVAVDTTVALDAAGSTDPDGTVVGYHWSQVGGTIVNLTDVSAVTAHFTAPHFVSAHVLTFQLIVTDNDSRVSMPDTVEITVQPAAPAPDAALPDATPAPDATPGADAEPGPDSAPAPDAGAPGIDGGGGCCQTGSGGTSALVLAGLVLLGLRRRRRR